MIYNQIYRCMRLLTVWTACSLKKKIVVKLLIFMKTLQLVLKFKLKAKNLFTDYCSFYMFDIDNS